MGGGRIFFRRGTVDFSRCSRKYFSRGRKSDEILSYPDESKETMFFAKNLIG